jgi:hypothetical protein
MEDLFILSSFTPSVDQVILRNLRQTIVYTSGSQIFLAAPLKYKKIYIWNTVHYFTLISIGEDTEGIFWSCYKRKCAYEAASSLT